MKSWNTFSVTWIHPSGGNGRYKSAGPLIQGCKSLQRQIPADLTHLISSETYILFFCSRFLNVHELLINFYIFCKRERTDQARKIYCTSKKNIRRQDCQHHCYLLVSFCFKFKSQCTVQLSTPQSVVDTYKVEKGEMTASTFMIMRHEHAHEKRKRVDIF